jgi:hypothetical protein
VKISGFKWLQENQGFYLTGQVVAAYSKYASLFRISGALHLGIFDQPQESDFFDTL